MREQPERNTRLKTRLHPVSWAWMRRQARSLTRVSSQLNVALIHKLRGPSMCMAYSFVMLSKDVYTTGYWYDVRSTSAELKSYTVATRQCNRICWFFWRFLTMQVGLKWRDTTTRTTMVPTEGCDPYHTNSKSRGRKGAGFAQDFASLW